MVIKNGSTSLKKTGKDGAFLGMREAFAGQRTLDDGLVGAPVEQVIEGHTEEQHRPWNHGGQRIRGVYRVKLFGRHIGDKIFDTRDKAAAAHHADGEDRDKEAADQQAGPVDGIGNCDRFQAAENRVNRADDADAEAQHGNRLKLGDAEKLVDIKNAVEGQRTRIEDGRQVGQQIAKQEKERNDALDGRVIALLEKLRDGGNARLKIARQEHHGET